MSGHVSGHCAAPYDPFTGTVGVTVGCDECWREVDRELAELTAALTGEA